MKKPKFKKIKSVKLNDYTKKFEKVQAYRAHEDTIMRLENRERYNMREGDYFVLIDRVNVVIIPERIFKKLFLFKNE